MSHLSSVPEKESLLGPFNDAFRARTSTLLAVTKLHSRISLLLTHVKSRHENATLSSEQNGTSDSALIYYKEG